MNFLDMRTVIIGHFFTNFLCTAVLAVVWAQNRKRFAGTGWWLLDFASQTVAVALIILRGNLPDWVSMTVANTLVVVGALLGYIGLTLFVGKKSPQLHNYILVAVFAVVHTYFIYVKPDLAARNLNLSLGLLIICSHCVWFILRRVEPGMRRMMRGVGQVFGIFCLVSLVRIVVILVNPSPNNDFFKSGLYDTIILMTYQILLILLAFNLITMVNQRLLGDVQFQEKKYATAFRSSPYAIILTRLPDSKILDVNNGFINITGYSYDEALGKTTLDLHLWDREDDHAEVISELSQGRRILGREFRFRKKSGEMIIGRMSAEVIIVDDLPWILSSIDDITERKQAEEIIRGSEERYRTILETAMDGFWKVDMQGCIVQVNDAYCRMSGYTMQELLAMRISDLETAETPNATAAHIQKVMRQGQDRFESQHRRKDGSVFDVEVSVQYRDGQFIGFLRDITERKRAEEAQSEHEALLRAMAENYPNSYVSIIEKDLTIGFTSGQEFKKQNLDPNQFVGMNLEQVFGEHAPLVRENYLKTFSGVETQFELLINNQHQLYRTVPLVDQSNRIYRILAVVENITERKQVEEALRKNEAHFREVFDNTAHGTFIIEVTEDGNFRIGDSNKAEEILTTIRREDVMGKLLVDAFPPDIAQALHANYNRCLEAGMAIAYEEEINLPGVGQRFYYTTLAPVRDESGRFYRIIGSTLEITNRKQMEEELRVQRHALAERVKELNCLYGIAKLIETPDISLEGILQGTVEFLPSAWQQPHQTCARLTMQKHTYQTFNFRQTDWRLSKEITLNGRPIGTLELFLLREPEHSDEAFLPEETRLLEAVAERISRVIERFRSEEALRENEVIFSSFLENSPVYVFFKDKNIRTLRLSKNYEQMLGMPISETIGKSMDELFPSPLAQSMVADDLRILKEGKRVDIVEEVNGRFYETTKFPIYIDDEPEMLAGFTMDITDRKRNEAILQIRLKLLEFAATHTLDELMQYALDEVGELTQSPIGFYHFVEPDEKTLSLQAWSTRTLQEFCQAEGIGMHHDIDQAGVWVDCVAQRKPVVHNDYASLPHRKGLPPGHAQVIRELVTPIFRDGRVVAILGVGNKPTNYDETDVASVSYMADIVWEIVKRKRAEEELHRATEQLSLHLAEIEQLQDELREQALHDPLTGLYNRRYLSETIEREIVRARRESESLSVIISDIDHFKIINDTYGHQVGDQFLVEIASLMKKHARGSDILCRYGGEEFLLVLPGTTLASATKRAEEIRQKCSEIVIPYEGKNLMATMSFGLATYPNHGQGAEEIIIKADKALYKSKQSGRDRVSSWEEDVLAKKRGKKE